MAFTPIHSGDRIAESDFAAWVNEVAVALTERRLAVGDAAPVIHGAKARVGQISHFSSDHGAPASCDVFYDIRNAMPSLATFASSVPPISAFSPGFVRSDGTQYADYSAVLLAAGYPSGWITPTRVADPACIQQIEDVLGVLKKYKRGGPPWTHAPVLFKEGWGANPWAAMLADTPGDAPESFTTLFGYTVYDYNLAWLGQNSQGHAYSWGPEVHFEVDFTDIIGTITSWKRRMKVLGRCSYDFDFSDNLGGSWSYAARVTGDPYDEYIYLDDSGWTGGAVNDWILTLDSSIPPVWPFYYGSPPAIVDGIIVLYPHVAFDSYAQIADGTGALTADISSGLTYG